MKILVRDIILVATVCGACLLAAYIAREIIDRVDRQSQVDQLLRRLHKEREAKEKREKEMECKGCVRA